MWEDNEGLDDFRLEDVLIPSNYIEQMTTHAIFEMMKSEYETKHGKLLDFPNSFFDREVNENGSKD